MTASLDLDLDLDQRKAPTPVPPAPPVRSRPEGRPPATQPELAPGFVPSTALIILAALVFTFVATVAVLGPVRHARDQATAWATLRANLANAVAPIGQLGDDGKPLPLGTPMAVLDIPQIGVREVVFEGTTSSVMRSGPAHRRDTPFPGQAGTSIIFGRRAGFGGPFATISRMSAGQVFTVTTGQGTFAYRVIGVRRAGDPVPDPLAAGKGRMTLITATGDRYVPVGVLRVDADLVSDVQPAGPRPITASSLPDAENFLKADPSVWVLVLLLTQALLLASLAVAWARSRWGRSQVWLTAVPLLFAIAVALSSELSCLLPNLM